MKLKTYKIKKGNHFSKWFPCLFNKTKLEFQVSFDESAEYHFDDEDQHDINKLYGFSDCNWHHHKNSARIGWRWDEETNQVELLAYCYVNGKRIFTPITKVEIYKWVDCSIEIKNGAYVFKIGDKQAFVLRNCNRKRWLCYKLYPYFGGNKKSPHEIKITIKE